MILFPQYTYTQIDYNKLPDDDLGNVSDAYKELFFEALKQKGIENYDRAIKALLKCIEIDDTESVLFYELGKNYNSLKDYDLAEKALKKAIFITPDNEWYLDELYEVYAKQNDYSNAIKMVKLLVKYHTDYKEDLATLYIKIKNYSDALKILDELDQELGVSIIRDSIRNKIYSETGSKKDQIKNLEKRMDENPDQEANYLALIYRYSENNEKEKAFETAKKLLEINPNSQLVHLALYKFYLDKNSTNKALESMKIVLKSNIINPEAKLMVFTDFVDFVKENPHYETDLIELTVLIGDNDSKSYIELAQYYLTTGDKINALKYYENALRLESENFGVLRNILLLYIDLERYEFAKEKSNEALDRYPSQPLFYLINGVALNKLNREKEAIDILEIGLDYIIDDTNMEIDFYKQLSIAHGLLNNTGKAKAFSDKVKQLEPTN